MPSVYKKSSMDEYLADFISSRYLCLERAVDEYIQAENELSLEAETTVDRFIDLELNISDDEIDDMIVDDIDTNEEYDVLDDDYACDDILISDVNALLDLEPEVNELDCDYDDDEA